MVIWTKVRMGQYRDDEVRIRTYLDHDKVRFDLTVVDETTDWID